jgi:hypothetical protein
MGVFVAGEEAFFDQKADSDADGWLAHTKVLGHVCGSCPMGEGMHKPQDLALERRQLVGEGYIPFYGFEEMGEPFHGCSYLFYVGHSTARK